MRRIAGVMSILALLAGTTAGLADSDRWTVMPENEITGVTGASICPYENPEGGRHNCISFECTPGEPLLFTASVAGFDQPGDLGVAITVDGEEIWDLRLMATGDGRYAKGMSGPQWSEGIEAMQTGLRGSVVFFTDEYLWRDHLPLAGSGDAIDHALSACWLSRQDASADPEAAARAEVTAYCRDSHNRAAVVNEGFARREDFDGDGRDDWLINYGTANCGPIGSAWCGWAGCEVAVHLARGEGFVEGFRGIAEGFRTVEEGMVFRRHGSECPADRAGPCAVLYRFTDDGMTRDGPAPWPPE